VCACFSQEWYRQVLGKIRVAPPPPIRKQPGSFYLFIYLFSRRWCVCWAKWQNKYKNTYAGYLTTTRNIVSCLFISTFSLFPLIFEILLCSAEFHCHLLVFPFSLSLSWCHLYSCSLIRHSHPCYSFGFYSRIIPMLFFTYRNKFNQDSIMTLCR